MRSARKEPADPGDEFFFAGSMRQSDRVNLL